ncbi:hypothetical protein SFUMM280S_01198 [Streptomyces fumanus]
MRAGVMTQWAGEPALPDAEAAATEPIRGPPLLLSPEAPERC